MRAKPKEWRIVRLQTATVDKLRALAASWVDNEWQDAPTGEDNRWDGHVSLDAVVQVLIEREYAIRQRRVDSAKNRARKVLEQLEGEKPQGSEEKSS